MEVVGEPVGYDVCLRRVDPADAALHHRQRQPESSSRMSLATPARRRRRARARGRLFLDLEPTSWNTYTSPPPAGEPGHGHGQRTARQADRGGRRPPRAFLAPVTRARRRPELGPDRGSRGPRPPPRRRRSRPAHAACRRGLRGRSRSAAHSAISSSTAAGSALRPRQVLSDCTIRPRRPITLPRSPSATCSAGAGRRRVDLLDPHGRRVLDDLLRQEENEIGRGGHGAYDAMFLALSRRATGCEGGRPSRASP